MVQKNIRRTTSLGLCAVVIGLVSGCDDVAKGILRGAADKMGAKAVAGSSPDELRKMFEKTNATCPMKVDIYTTLESAELIDATHAEFRYLVNDEGKKFAVRFDKQAMKAGAVEYLKGKAMAVAIAERDLSVLHIYEDRSGNHVLSYIINKAVLNGDLEPLGDERSNPFHVETVKSDSSQSVTKGTTARPRENGGRPMKNPAGVQENPYF